MDFLIVIRAHNAIVTAESHAAKEWMIANCDLSDGYSLSIDRDEVDDFEAKLCNEGYIVETR